MSDATNSATRTERFNAAVRAFTLPPPARHTKLMPLKEGIIELRQKGASVRVIRELLATVGVTVGTYTIARFLAEVNGEPEPRSRPKRSHINRRSESTPTPTRPVAGPMVNPLPTPIQAPVDNAASTPPIERSRARGPRVADPRNL